MDETAESPPAAGPEHAAEKLNPKEQVTKALQEGLSIFEADVAAKPDQDSQETKNQLAEIAEAKRKLESLTNGGDGTDTVELKDEKGKVIKTQKEGIPVYEMLQHLENKLKSMPKSSPQAKELRGMIRTLTQKKFTRDYLDLPYRWVPKYYQARVREEVSRMKADGRSTGDETQDEKIAWESIAKRRELFTPSDEQPPTESDLRFTVAVVNIDDDAKKVAREESGEYVREQLVVKHKLNPLEWFRAIKFRLGEEYHKYKGAEKIQAAQIKNGQYFVTLDAATGAVKEMNAGKEAMRKQGTATAERFALAKEGKTEIQHQEEAQDLVSKEVTKQISGLLTRFAKGELNEEQFSAEKDKLIKELQKNPDIAPYIRDARFVGDNLLEVARKVKLSHERGQLGLKNLDRMLDIQLGRAVMAATTEADYSRIEQVMNKLQNTRYLGFLANPLAIGLMFGMAGSASSAMGAGARWATGISLAGAPIGAAFASWRRWTDLKRDHELQERDAAYSRAGEDKRRQKLEEFRVNRAEGGGRVSAKGLLSEITTLTSADLSAETSQDALLAKVAEIDARINYGIDNKVDLMVFSDRLTTESEKFALIKASIEAKAKLQNEGLSDKDIDAKLKEKADQFWKQLKSTQEEQDKRFDKFRRMEALKAAAFGLVTGVGGGLLGQEAGALVRRAMGHTVGTTLLEGAINNVRGFVQPDQAVATASAEAAAQAVAGTGETAAGGAKRVAGFAIDQAREGFAHPDQLPNGAINISDNLRIDVDPAITDGARHITFHDAAGNLIPTGPARLTPDGTIVVSGDVPDSVRSVLSGFESRLTHNPNLNIKEGIADWFQNPARHDTFQFGDLTVDINPANAGETVYRTSMTLYEGTPNAVRIHGVLKEIAGRPVFDIDSANPANADLNPQKLASPRNALSGDGWGLEVDHVDALPSKGTVVDALLNQNPNVLKAKGIIETDQFDKTWNNHVLRPDIVSATGMHTHNELTLHLGGEYQVLTDAGAVTRAGIGNPGEINFGGELTSGRIESHLFGVPPQVDSELAGALARNNGIKLSDLVAVVDTTDGRQIMLPLDGGGNVKLPAEFFDAQTGNLHGVKDIAAVYLQKPDGSLLSGKELLESGQIPTGSVVHSLAAEKFVEIPSPPMPPTPGHDIYHLTPPDATEFVPPEPKFEAPPPPPPPPPEESFEPFFTTPWGRRYPLGPREEILILYGYGGGYSGEGLGWMGEDELERRKSERLKENPYAQLDEEQEVADYLSRMDPDYRAELEKMDASIGTPMSSETRTVITIPAFGEGKNIRKTLTQYLNQKDRDGNPVNPALFEIIIYENDTQSRPKDNTEDEVRRFQAEHPELKIHYVYKRWSQEDIDNKINTIGNGRRYTCDLALLRSSKRTAKSGELIIINQDADLEGITPRYISDIVEEFDSKDYLDTIVGKRNLPNSTLQKPNIRAGQRLWETFDAVMRHTGGGGSMEPSERQRGWPGMIGENSAMRAAIYAAVGGYNPTTTLAEDQELGYMMRRARNYDDKRFEYINRLQTIKNPRRYLAYMIMGRPLHDMYNDYHENKDIRNQDNRKLLNRISNSFNLARFQMDADAIYQKNPNNGYYSSMSQQEFEARFQRTMEFMGAEYKIENGHVKITNTSRMLQGLKRNLPNTPEGTSSRLTQIRNRITAINQQMAALPAQGGREMVRLANEMSSLAREQARLISENAGKTASRLKNNVETTSAMAITRIQSSVDNLIGQVKNLPAPALPNRAAIINQLQSLRTEINRTNSIPSRISQAQTRINSIIQSLPPVPTPNLQKLTLELDKLSNELRKLAIGAGTTTRGAGGAALRTTGSVVGAGARGAVAGAGAAVRAADRVAQAGGGALFEAAQTMGPVIERTGRNIAAGTIEATRSANERLGRLKQSFQETPEQKAANLQRNLNRDLLLATNRLSTERQNGTAKISQPFPTGGKFLWQEVTYGPDRKLDGDHCFRGYLMIEPEDMPKALTILSALGRNRQSGSKSLDFKWLMNTWDASPAYDPKALGSYKLEPTDPRVAIYADTKEEIQEILDTLASNADWQAIEQRRIDKMGGLPQNAPRRPGTNAYFDPGGREWRSLNYNNNPGYSEDEAKDPDWRTFKLGSPTVFVPKP